ncbi:MAG: CoA transferase [Chloroflexi bacterium]|nr:CoA transferase [Chloroflexota bacterium]
MTQEALAGARVLELAGVEGVYCTRLLANLGADVLKVEPPGGSAERNLGPFYHGEPHPDKSLHFFYYNVDKKSITLNLETSEGREMFRRLVASRDILVETTRPGYLDGLGIGYEALNKINPRLVMTSITPFGLTGPYRDYKSTDLVSQAMGGLLYVMGYPDTPPVIVGGGDQAYHMASVHASVATLIALHHAEMTGEGQQVDVAIHQCIPIFMQRIMLTYAATGKNMVRIGMDSQYPIYRHFKCRDGWMYVTLRDRWSEFVQWLLEEEAADDLADPRYQEEAYRNEQRRHIDDVFQRFVQIKSMTDVCREAQKRRIWALPVNSVQNIYSDPQLVDRQYFIPVSYPELGDEIVYPGVPYRLAESPATIHRRAPLVGEHNREVYCQELGLTEQHLEALKANGIV